MTGPERVMAALSGVLTDRPPYGLVCGSLGARLAGYEPYEGFGDPELYVKGQEAAAALLDPDIVFTPFVLAYEAVAYDGELAPQRGAVYNLRRPPFRNLRDAARALRAAPTPLDAAGLRFMLEATKRLADAVAGSRMVVAPIASPVDFPALLIGIEAWLDALLFEPDAASELASAAVEHFAALASAYAAAGAQALASPVMFVNPSILDERRVRELALPILAEGFSRSPLPIVFHHGGNPLSRYLGLFGGLPQVAGFVLGERDDYADARAAIGAGPLLMATVPGPTFAAFTPDTLRARLAALFEKRGADPAWGFTNAGAELPAETPPELLAFVRDFFRGRA